jgi:peptide/nickel transport system substrate-binding protein
LSVILKFSTTAPRRGAVFVFKQATAAGLALSLGLGLVGCADDTDRPAPDAPKLDTRLSAPKPEDAPTGRYGGTLTLASYDAPKTFNPTLANDPASLRTLAYVFDGLVEEDGLSYEVEPVLAESWRVSADGKRYTFTLRPGLTWHDGKPLTADDVVFTVMTVLRHPDVPWEARHALRINGQLPSATRVDAQTVRFDLPAPFAPFLRAIAGPGLPILPKHVFGPWMKAKGDDGKPLANAQWGLRAVPTSVVGSGPFMLAAYKPGEAVELTRNPRYFRVNRHNQPLPYLDRLVLAVKPGLAGAIAGFEGGQTDLQWLPAQVVTTLKDRAKAEKFSLHDGGPDFRISYLTFNLNPRRDVVGKPLVDPIKLKWFSDARFRQAIAYAIDREALVRDVYHGMAVLQPSPVFQKSPYFDAKAPAYALDRAKAKQLLTQAGFTLKGTQLHDAAGHPVRFSLLYETGATETQAQVKRLQADLAAIGVTIKPEGVPFKAKLDRTYRKRNWEAQIGAWSAGIEPHAGAQLWMSNGLAHILNLNPAGGPHATPTYAWEKRIDQLFAQGVSTLDEAQRKKVYGEFQRLVGREQPMIFLPVFRYTVAVRDSVGNARPSAYSPLGASWNSYELYKRR